MEAMWTRYLPVIQKLKVWLEEGVIGEVRQIRADLGIRRPFGSEHRLFNPNLAGSALLDLGIYPISFAFHVMDEDPEEVVSMAALGPTGVDEGSAYMFRYRSGAMAVLSSGTLIETNSQAQIFGTDGFITLPDFWKAERITKTTRTTEEHYESNHEANGMEYEAAEVMECLKLGRKESELMPLDETVRIMGCLDKIRGQWGLRYPDE